MFDGIEGFGRQLFLSIYLIVCTIIAANLCFGYDFKRRKEVAIVGMLCLVIGIQYYYLLDVVTFVPATRYYVYNVRKCVLLVV